MQEHVWGFRPQRELLCFAVAGVVLLGQSLAQAQAPVGNNAMVALLPALRTAPPPQWVRPGMRLTYYSAAASIPGRRHSYYRDEDGNWVDEQGRRHRREDEPSASGHGYTQVNVVALGQVAVLDVRSYSMVNVTGPPILLSQAGVADVPGCPGAWWVNPAVLRQAVGMQGEGTVVLRMPYKIQNRTYQAIRIQYTARNAKTAFVFDEPSGVLLFTNNSVFTPASQRTLLSYSSYRGTRTVQIPWAADAVPNWLATIQSLQYSGSHTVQVPGVQAIPLPMSAQAQIKSRGVNWLQYSLAVQVGGVSGLPPSTSQAEAVSGYAQIGGLFVSPVGLSRLRQGQTIDQDPLTGVTTTVSQVGPSGGGRHVVVISEIGQMQRCDYAYDWQTGMLVGLSTSEQSLHTTRRLQLTGTR